MGIVLVNMLTGDMPFNKALENDKLYKYFAKGRGY